MIFPRANFYFCLFFRNSRRKWILHRPKEDFFIILVFIILVFFGRHNVGDITSDGWIRWSWASFRRQILFFLWNRNILNLLPRYQSRQCLPSSLFIINDRFLNILLVFYDTIWCIFVFKLDYPVLQNADKFTSEITQTFQKKIDLPHKWITKSCIFRVWQIENNTEKNLMFEQVKQSKVLLFVSFFHRVKENITLCYSNVNVTSQQR